jgi:hypothetical protein
MIWPFFDSYPENGQFQTQKLRSTSQDFNPRLTAGIFFALSPLRGASFCFIDENHPKIERFNALVELISLQRID